MMELFEELRTDTDMQDFEYRHSFADADLNAIIAMQIKAIREQRGMTQTQLAYATEMAQPRISVLEDINYSSWSIATLKRIARAFDVRLRVRFEEFGTFETDLAHSKTHLKCRPFTDDPKFKPDWNSEMEIQNNITDVVELSELVTDDTKGDAASKIVEVFEIDSEAAPHMAKESDATEQASNPKCFEFEEELATCA